MGGNAPTYDGVGWPAGDGIRVPTEVFGTKGAATLNGTLKLHRTASHDYGAAHADWTLLPGDTQASYITVTDASQAANAVWPAAFNGHVYVVYNNSGFNITFKVTGQTGITVANGKRAILVCDGTDIQRVTADT